MKLLLIDDCAADRENCLRLLRGENLHPFEVREAESIAMAIEALGDYDPDCVILDYRLPDGDGFDFLNEVSAETSSVPIPVILMTGMASDEVAAQAVQAGAQDCLDKDSLDRPTLVRVLRYAMDRHRMFEAFGSLQIAAMRAFTSKYALALYEHVAKRARLRYRCWEEYGVKESREILGVPGA